MNNYARLSAVFISVQAMRHYGTDTVRCFRGIFYISAEPFIISAMSSHGLGTEKGQRELMREYGITEESVGVPIVTTVDTVQLG